MKKHFLFLAALCLPALTLLLMPEQAFTGKPRCLILPFSISPEPIPKA